MNGWDVIVGIVIGALLIIVGIAAGMGFQRGKQ